MSSETPSNPSQQDAADQPHKSACDSMPDLTRLKYFHGLMLEAKGLQTEQDYFLNKLKLHNRCLHGYGTVCGLKVKAVKFEQECDPKIKQQSQKQSQQQQSPACVEIECGMAIDCEGNELIVRHSLEVDLWQRLPDAEKNRIENSEEKAVYLSLCFCEQPIDPVRPVIPDACGAISECVYSKLRDSVHVKVTTEKPCEDQCRNNCCDKCKDKCLLLAKIDFVKGPSITDENIHNDVRRWIALYEPVTITGISWVHGADWYTPEQTAFMLQKQGLTIEFSRPIGSKIVAKGVVDVLVFEGGRGRHAGIYFLDLKTEVSSDKKQLTFWDTTNEELQDGDRVLIIVRTDFILDECCRPVDGNHVGGRVPLLEGVANKTSNQEAQQSYKNCVQPPNRYGSWVSGNGSPGGTFESWFYVKSPPRSQK